MDAESITKVLGRGDGYRTSRVLVRCEVSGAPYHHDIAHIRYDSTVDAWVLTLDLDDVVIDEGKIYSEEEWHAELERNLPPLLCTCLDCGHKWEEEDLYPTDCPSCASRQMTVEIPV